MRQPSTTQAPGIHPDRVAGRHCGDVHAGAAELALDRRHDPHADPHPATLRRSDAHAGGAGPVGRRSRRGGGNRRGEHARFRRPGAAPDTPGQRRNRPRQPGPAGGGLDPHQWRDPDRRQHGRHAGRRAMGALAVAPAAPTRRTGPRLAAGGGVGPKRRHAARKHQRRQRHRTDGHQAMAVVLPPG